MYCSLPIAGIAVLVLFRPRSPPGAVRTPIIHTRSLSLLGVDVLYIMRLQRILPPRVSPVSTLSFASTRSTQSSALPKIAAKRLGPSFPHDHVL